MTADLKQPENQSPLPELQDDITTLEWLGDPALMAEN
jgi:hypothetical protein